MSKSTRRVVTGHDGRGKSVILSDDPPPQNHSMRGLGVGADFHEMWSCRNHRRFSASGPSRD
jgi:hypothetical protein